MRKAYFHSDLPYLVVEESGVPPAVHLINCPSALPPFKGDALTDKSFIWPTELVVIKSTYTLPLGHWNKFTSFRRGGRGPTMLDVIHTAFSDEESVFHHLTISRLDELIPQTSSRKIEEYQFGFECRTSSCRRILVGSHLDGPIFLRMPDTPSEESALTRLEVPYGVEGSSFVAFDDVYGTLLLTDKMGNYVIAQY